MREPRRNARSGARLAVAVAAAFVFVPPVIANPTGPALVSGAAQMSNPSPNLLQVVNTPGTIINWTGFSIAGGETTRFVQLNAASAVLNRVTGGNPSSILGRLESNGRVFLVNPNGIVFGGSSVVDVAGLIASTRDISNDNFTNGNYAFSGGGIGNVTLQIGAQILTSGSGGQVWLIANQVNAEAGSRITAPQGQVVLAAGSSVQVGTSHLGGMSFTVQPGAGNSVEALGEIVAQRGAVGFFADSVNIGNAVSAKGGSVTVSATRDVVVRSGTSMDASGSGNENGGAISIQAGGRLQMDGTAELNADGGMLGGNGGRISLAAHDLRLPVAGLTRGASLVHALASSSTHAQGEVLMTQTGSFSYTGTDRDIRTIASPVNTPGAVTVPGMDGGFLSVYTPGSSDSATREIRVYGSDGAPRGAGTTLAAPGFQNLRSSGLSDGSYMVLWNDSGVHSMQLINANGTLNGGPINLTARGQTVFDIQPLLSGGFVALGSAGGTARFYDTNAALVRTITGVPAGTFVPMARGFAIVNPNGTSGYTVQRYDGAGDPVGEVTQYGRSDIAFASPTNDFTALTSLAGQQLHADGHFALPNFGISATLLPGQQFLASKNFTDPLQVRRFSIGGVDALGPGFTDLNGSRAGLADGSFASATNALVSVRGGDGATLLSETVASNSFMQPTALGNGGLAVVVREQVGPSSYRLYTRTYEKAGGGVAPVPGTASGGAGQSADFATRPGAATNTGVPPASGGGTPTVVTGSGAGASFGGVATYGCNAAVCSPEVRAAVALVTATRGAQSAAEAFNTGGGAAVAAAAENSVRAVWAEVVNRRASPEDIQREEAAILRDQREVAKLVGELSTGLEELRKQGKDTFDDRVETIKKVIQDYTEREMLYQQTGLSRTVPTERKLVDSLLNMDSEERRAFGETLVTLMQTDPTFGEAPSKPAAAPAPAIPRPDAAAATQPDSAAATQPDSAAPAFPDAPAAVGESVIVDRPGHSPDLRPEEVIENEILESQSEALRQQRNESGAGVR